MAISERKLIEIDDLPDWLYDPDNTRLIDYSPDEMRMYTEIPVWAKAKGIMPAPTDTKKLELLIIDAQRDFCFPEGTLFVGGRSGTGAMDDSKRLVEWGYRNINYITQITPTFDTHFVFQIFSPIFWIQPDGSHPEPFQAISVDDIRSGKFRPNPVAAKIICNGNYTWLMKYVEHYCRELEARGKYLLYLWPPHCLLGSRGHSLAGVVHEMRLVHSLARGSQSLGEVKGGNPLTENYSVLSPEVLVAHDGVAIAQRNTRFMEKLLTADYVVIAGQAASHCVSWTIDDLLTEIASRDESLARKVYIMRDCTSSVTVPDGSGGFFADFTDDTEAAFKRFEYAGMNLVTSDMEIENWPGIEF